MNKVAMQRFYTLFVTERSRLSAARFSFKLASRKQPWAAPDCMLALLRACMACRGLIAAAKRMSAAFGDARSALLDSAHRAMCIALFSTDETLSCALSAGGGHHRQVVPRVKIIDFSKTTLLSCSQRADHGTLRGSASFALVHEKVWSKVNWLLDQVNLYLI